MRRISKKNRAIINTDPYYKTCARKSDGGCKGRITIEHALIFAGRQIDEIWNLIPLCEFHHAVCNFQDGGDLQKEKNVLIALNRAKGSELVAISKAINYFDLRKRLNKKYAIQVKGGGLQQS